MSESKVIVIYMKPAVVDSIDSDDTLLTKWERYSKKKVSRSEKVNRIIIERYARDEAKI